MITDLNNCESFSPFRHAAPSRFKSIDERDDEFLELFPHRGSYLWAEHTSSDDRPQWRTENRHLLTDRLINQGSFLYGVRFGAKTNYLLIDIDRASPYHPYRDPFAIGRIAASLEPLGLLRSVAISSSYSAGVHLYFPFVLGLPCWAIAQAAACLLENAGFKLNPGQIELFPNARQYSDVRADYNGHRLPLQVGSYLLDADWQPMWSDRPSFVRAWRAAADVNHTSIERVQTVLKQADRRAYRRIRGNAAKFLSDLNAEIEMGWTGYGQTNRLIGRIAMREYIFHHALHGGEPLTGDRLASEIMTVAESLPGFEVWCRHQHELVRLCRNWAREVEAEPRYYPYLRKTKPEALEDQQVKQDPNQRKSAEARQRLTEAVDRLIAAGEFPAGTRARMMVLKASGVGTTVLTKNRQLWHPDHRPAAPESDPNGPEKQDDPQSLEALPCKEIPTVEHNKLSRNRGDAPQEQSPRESQASAVGGSGGEEIAGAASQPTGPGPELITMVLRQIRATTAAKRAADSTPAPAPDESYFARPAPAPTLPAGLNPDPPPTCQHPRATPGLDGSYCPDCGKTFDRDTATYRLLAQNFERSRILQNSRSPAT